MFAEASHGVGIKDADPAEHDDDDGSLEGDAEGEAHVEDGFDVFGDAVLLDDPDVGHQVDGADDGVVGRVEPDDDALLHVLFINPGHAEGWGLGVGFEDGDHRDGDAGGNRGGRDEWIGGNFRGVADEEGEDDGEDDEVEEEDGEDGEESGEGDEDVDDAPFVFVQTG